MNFDKESKSGSFMGVGGGGSGGWDVDNGRGGGTVKL